MQPFSPWFDQVWPRSKIARNPLKVCMHGYLSNGYLNSLSNFTYKKVRKIWSLRNLLPWIIPKITSNIVKFGEHCYLPNAKINLRSNFNFEKLVKGETLFDGFVEVGIKGGEIFWNVSKFPVHACLSNGHPNLWSTFNYKKLLKSETRNPQKLYMYALSMKWIPKYSFKLQFQESQEKCIS